MKVGDLVRGLFVLDEEQRVGIVIEVIDHIEVPPVVKVLWPDGVIDKAWTDDIEVVSRSLTDEQLEDVRGGMSLERFNDWRARALYECR